MRASRDVPTWLLGLALLPWVVILGLSCAHPVPVTTAPDPAPSHFGVVPRLLPATRGPVLVLTLDSLPVALPANAPDGTVVLGAYINAQRVVLLRRDLGVRTIAVLLHERCHVELADHGIHGAMPESVEDAVCNAWGESDARDLAAGTLGFAQPP